MVNLRKSATLVLNVITIFAVYMLLVGSLNFATAHAGPAHRWIFIQNSFQENEDLCRIEDILKTGKAFGFNGIVLASRLDSLDQQAVEYSLRIKRLKFLTEQYGFDIIPLVFSVGYAASIISNNENFAEGYPVTNLYFRINAGQGLPYSVGDELVADLSFDKQKGLSIEKPGQISFVDKEVVHSSTASLRMENFNSHSSGNARVALPLKVTALTAYTASFWMRGDGLPDEPPLQVKVFSPTGTCIMWRELEKPGKEWRKISMDFFSLENMNLQLVVGIWSGTSGRVWINDLKVAKQQELVNVIQRQGAPLSVKNAMTGESYQEGRDFFIRREKINDGTYRIQAKSKAAIPDGTILTVSYYRKYTLGRGQVTACMAMPEVYKIWKKQISLIEDLLQPKTYFLSLDEIRQGGFCELCKKHNMADLLGYCVNTLYGMIREYNPGAQVFFWSDMFDPYMGAVNDYVMVRGGFTGSWRHLPDDVVPVIWEDSRRRDSSRHFKSKGFKIMHSVCADGKSKADLIQQKEILAKVGVDAGVMYTTWQKDYSRLSQFGEVFFE